jgi:hypothetical protein
LFFFRTYVLYPGLRHRERKVVVAGSHSGRNCPHLQEVVTCQLLDCHDFDWEFSDWGECQPHWNLHCGKGYQYREVRCPAGSEYEKKCAARQTQPPLQTECVKPCVGKSCMCQFNLDVFTMIFILQFRLIGNTVVPTTRGHQILFLFQHFVV